MTMMSTGGNQVQAVRGRIGKIIGPCLLASVLGISVNSEEPRAGVQKLGHPIGIAQGYSCPFGKDRPFLPSNIDTFNGTFLSPNQFPTAKYCGHCHQETHAQWRQSAHSNSNRAPWYLKNVALLNSEKGVEYSRHCEGCHNPIAVVSGALTSGAATTRPYDQDGVTCVVCHSIIKVDSRGTGSFTLGVPSVLVDGNGNPITRAVSDAEILAHLDRHSAAVMRGFYRSSEFCAACHKAALPRELNDYKWQRAISLYDEWQNSAFSKESPLSFYRKDSVSTCQSCHMPRERLVGSDYGAKDDSIASHRWVGANTMLPKYYGFDEQMTKVVNFLRTSVFDVDIFAIERRPDATGGMQQLSSGKRSTQGAGKDEIIAPLGESSFEVRAGDHLIISVVVGNRGIGHSHVPEQRDMYESWIDFSVKDPRGNLICESGALGPDGTLDRSAHTFTNRLVNQKGTLNGLHEVWNNRAIAYNNTIQPGRSQLIRYGFTIPHNRGSYITVTATVKYRRFDQHFINFGLSKGYAQPVIEMASSSRIVKVGINGPMLPLTGTQNDNWIRWNDYGIALLDEHEYRASAEAFRHVTLLRPNYADAYTNAAIPEIQSEHYETALLWIAKSLAILPGNPRALYYRALAERHLNEINAATADLQAIASEFPRSRDVHRELGYCYYLKDDLGSARTEYEQVQTIDPDDISAHYNLSIIYRRLGLSEKAASQAAYFADQKDDPTASVYALEYLRMHPEVAHENSFYHVHDLDRLEDGPVEPNVDEQSNSKLVN